jgi:zinc/manganese transport system substrate-binding protein
MIPVRALAPVLAGLVALGWASPSAASARPVIVTGVTQWAALARSLAGPGATVVSLVSDPNADPHEHEATARDATQIARASVVIENGAGYDSWVERLVRARSSRPRVIDVARLAGVRTGQNPHLFYSVAAAHRLVSALAAVLERAHVPGVAARARRLTASLDATGATERQIGRACGATPVAATEDVAGYLLAETHLEVVTPARFRLAIGNGVDPSIHDLALTLIQLRHHPALLVNNVQTSTPLTAMVVQQAHASRVPVLNLTETMTGRDYVPWIDGVVTRLAGVLTRRGCLA